jgi:hypothetical protein
MQSGSVTVTTSGTPVSLARATTPAAPTISSLGVTNSIAGANQFGQVTIQNPPGSVGNLYVGSPTMTKLTAIALIPGQFVTIGNALAKIILDQVWVDSDTSGNKAVFLAI